MLMLMSYNVIMSMSPFGPLWKVEVLRHKATARALQKELDQALTRTDPQTTSDNVT
jgi:hypothetical protein